MNRELRTDGRTPRLPVIVRRGWREARHTDHDGLPRGRPPAPPREERIIDVTLRAGQQ